MRIIRTPDDLTDDERELVRKGMTLVTPIYQSYIDMARDMIAVLVDWWDALDDETKRAITEEASPDETGGVTLDELLGRIDDVIEEPT